MRRYFVRLIVLVALVTGPLHAYKDLHFTRTVAAQISTPIGSPAPDTLALCTIEPRPVEDFVNVDEESNDAISALFGTPVATPTPPSGGVPADSSVVEGVMRTMAELSACANTGDIRRVAALLTDEQFRRSFGGLGQRTITGLGTPSALPAEARVPEILVTNVMILPDGRVSAVTQAEGERALTVFRLVGDRYLIDASYKSPVEGTPVP